MSSFESDGLTIHYQYWGEGHPLLLVHGWGSDTTGNWVDTGWVEALAPHRRVIGLDCRGHGKSSKPHDQERYSYRAMSNDVIALMNHLDIESADYFGYSMGAFMGASLLGTHAGRFSGFVLGGIGNETDESAGMCTTIAAALRAHSIDDIAGPVGRAYRRFVSANPDNDLEALALSALQMWPEGYPLTLGGTSINRASRPVLIVNGSHDLPYVASSDALAAAIPCTSAREIPCADHLSAVTHPDFKRIVLAFLGIIPTPLG